MTFRTVTVDLGSRSYPVEIGVGVRNRLADHLPDTAKRVAIVTQDEIPVEVQTGLDQRVFSIGQGEAHKTLDTISTLCLSLIHI